MLLAGSVSAADKVLLYAAASTSMAVNEVIKQFKQTSPAIKVKVSFASSSTLAKQIEAGAPADLYISANPKWMDYLQARDLLVNTSRQDLLSNKIVLIAPKGQYLTVPMTKGFDFANQLTGRLCMGEPSHVPVGMYAKQALVSLGWWAQLKASVVGTKDVRAVLTFVERGECAAGIVYATDASSSQKVELIAEFPASSHSPIVYPVAALVANNKAVDTFLQYLSSAQAITIFKEYGFSTQ
ncbi:MAG: molybdate transport system substrate-binding protein [Methyloprofundus sp.]|nr:MAG: molybdate transport system substrate-binding protein [Methyloprofundus sp.]